MPSRAPGELPLEMCTCSFCRKHAAVTANDPDGQLLLEIADASEAVRYRFETGSADYLLCGRCGVFVASVMSTNSGAVASLNVNVLDDRASFDQMPEILDFGNISPQTAQERRLRRAETWTVATIIVPDRV